MTVAHQRILRGTPATLTVTLLDQDGAAADATGAVTVHVAKADGTTVLAAGTATTNPAGDGTYTASLTAAQTATLDLLTVTWTDAGDSSTHVTYVEIVGGYYFTVAEARAADSSLTDTGKYTDADIIAARREVEDEFERICGVAFVPRYRRATLDGTGTCRLLAVDPRIRTVRSVRDYSDWPDTYTAFTADELADVQADDTNLLTAAVWPRGTRNIVVEYEHGYDRPPAEVKRAAITRLRARLNMARSGIPDRATSYVAAEGGTFRLDMPGAYKTGMPEVDAVLARYTHRSVLIG